MLAGIAPAQAALAAEMTAIYSWRLACPHGMGNKNFRVPYRGRFCQGWVFIVLRRAVGADQNENRPDVEPAQEHEIVVVRITQRPVGPKESSPGRKPGVG